ncbi:hypothetical protein YB2330_005167 [Saitoella coloradoensis]
MSNLKAIIIPGIGCDDIRDANWYRYIHDELEKTGLFPRGVVLRDFPDPFGAKESVWLPFIKSDIGVDEDTVLIGHSSGASAAMRLTETTKVCGSLLVSAALTDQDDPTERESGYFNRPFDYAAISANNTKLLLQLSGSDDHLVPCAEQREVANGLFGGEKTATRGYMEMEGKGHFLTEECPEVVEVLVKALEELRSKL